MAIQQKSVPYTFPNGIKMKLYTIGSLASALGRSSATVRKWEISGILPKTPLRVVQVDAYIHKSRLTLLWRLPKQ